jgi:HK97 family phage portal protein
MLERLRTFLLPERKSAAPWVTLHLASQPNWSPRSYASLTRDGFAANVIGYRCVRMIAEAAASLPLLVYVAGEEVADHPLKALLSRPNPGQSGRDLLESLYGFLMVAGNAYAELVSLDGAPRELFALRPDRVRVVPQPSGWPEAFTYEAGGKTTRLPREAVLHLKLFNPGDDHYGLSPLEAAHRSIETHNSAANWNKAMLDNAARPSGALVFSGGDGHLSSEQFERLKAELETNYQGASHAGRPMVLEGGLDWKEMGFSPKEMEFIEAKNTAAREVALAFGVPPMLLGIPGDNTYANYAEANRSFWRQTILPLAGRVAEALGHWLEPHFGPVSLIHDLDQVEALALDRDALWSRLEKASFLTVDEKREAVGYGPLAVRD